MEIGRCAAQDMLFNRFTSQREHNRFTTERYKNKIAPSRNFIRMAEKKESLLETP